MFILSKYDEKLLFESFKENLLSEEDIMKFKDSLNIYNYLFSKINKKDIFVNKENSQIQRSQIYLFKLLLLFNIDITSIKTFNSDIEKLKKENKDLLDLIKDLKNFVEEPENKTENSLSSLKEEYLYKKNIVDMLYNKLKNRGLEYGY